MSYPPKRRTLLIGGICAIGVIGIIGGVAALYQEARPAAQGTQQSKSTERLTSPNLGEMRQHTRQVAEVQIQLQGVLKAARLAFASMEKLNMISTK